MKVVTVLVARADSIYKEFPFVDVWDQDRDALLWPGGTPIVAHPPCGQWGRLRPFARVNPQEKALAPWAVSQVRKWGGVLEHPRYSTLWKEVGLPAPGCRDAFGGWTLSVPQFWWGHKAKKATWLYLVGIDPGSLDIPFVLGEPSHVISTVKKDSPRPEVPRNEREATPVKLAKWLCEIAVTARVGA